MQARLSALLFLLAATLSMPALSAAYIKFDGVDGESTDRDHKGWIDVMSVSQARAPRDAASGLPTGKRQHKPLTITKPIDKASPILAKSLANGSPLSNVTVSVDGHVTVLKSAKVVSIDRDSSGNEIITLAPVETPVESPVENAVERKKGNVEATWKVEEGTK